MHLLELLQESFLLWYNLPCLFSLFNTEQNALFIERSNIDIDEIQRKSVATDIESISLSVQKFVKGKQLEIKNLTEIDSFRRDFLGNVAHELKTPLFTVQGYILTLIEGAANDKEIRTKYLNRANKGVERLVAVIKDLDMIAKLETDGIKH